MEIEIQELVKKKAIEAVSDLENGFYSPVFVVLNKDGGWRPIMNLKKLNRYLQISHFKMENISNVKDVLHLADYLGKIDLKDAYLAVPIFIGHRKYLRFSWKGKHFQFKSLPLGLATAPRVFSKLLRPLAALTHRLC